MTQLENVNNNSQTINNEASNDSAIEESSQQSTSSSPKLKKATSLRNRLLLWIVPTVLVPMIGAAGAGFWIANNTIRSEYREELKRQSLLAQIAMSDLVDKLSTTPEQLAENPLVIEAARDGSKKVIDEELTNLSQQKLENQFDLNLLNPNANFNNYLQDVVRQSEFTEIVITEKHGFNVGYNERATNFVHRGESWWQKAKNEQQWIGDKFQSGITETNNSKQLPLTHAIEDPTNDQFLGVIHLGVPPSEFQIVESYINSSNLLETEKVQVLSPSSKQVLATVTPEEGFVDKENLAGGDVINSASKKLINAQSNPAALLPQIKDELRSEYEVSNVKGKDTGESIVRLRFSYDGRTYELVNVPKTDWVAISSVDNGVLQTAGQELITIFGLIGGGLGVVSIGVVFLLARQLSTPLTRITESAQKAAAGNLETRALPEGSYETQVLAESYNNLVERVQQLLNEQEETAEQQRKQREGLEEEVSQLVDEVEGASEGDLTVRAQLMAGDIGIVADLFNSVVENLQDTARQVKETASEVNRSLGENESAIREVSEGAIAEAEEIQSTLNAISEMNNAIQEVAQNAQQAADVADTAYNTAQEGNNAMEETVASIQELRNTVGETSKKMKQMGESAQKISQVVSLIDEISLKTSLLAINASVEANRAGEVGQGFTAVAEQVESLAEQSASAAKEISQIVTNIQTETQEAIETMEKGTTEVVESTRSVEQTKERLANVVEQSAVINNLMQSISQSTISQAESSQQVSQTMQQLAESSQQRSETSREVAENIQNTAQVAKNLEESVEQFKVDK